jgi:dihydroorotate dehydrogenase (fumarate)
MIDLSTSYMGLKLKNPIIAASSGLTDSVEKVVNLAKEGIGAVVLKSLFEEQILMEVNSLKMNNMFNSYTEAENYISYYTREHNVNEYLKLIEESKKAVDIPIIASINCVSAGEWIQFAKKIESAGADAIELNMFILPSDPRMKGVDIENIYFEIISQLKNLISIPIAVKLSPYFSGMADTMVKLSDTGIGALVMFNRFYNPDIDLMSEKLTISRIFSVPEENTNNLRWIGLLSGKLNCDISSTTGIDSGQAVLKNILAGAGTVQIASVLYKHSIKYISEILEQINTWMISKNYSNINTLRGKLSASNIKHPVIYERAQFMKYYSEHN